MAVITCKNCGKQKERASSKAKYCDDSCKSQYFRAKRSNVVADKFAQVCDLLRDMRDEAEQYPQFQADDYERAIYRLKAYFERDVVQGHSWQCVRSGQRIFLDDKPQGQCDYCKSQEKKVKQKDAKERYSGDCMYIYMVMGDRNDIPLNLSDYDWDFWEASTYE